MTLLQMVNTSVIAESASERLFQESIVTIVLVLLICVLLYASFKGGKAMISAIDRSRASFEGLQKETNEVNLNLAIAMTKLSSVIEDDISEVKQAVEKNYEKLEKISEKLTKINAYQYGESQAIQKN